MRQQSRFQMNVSVVTDALKRRSGIDDPEQEAAKVWKKFLETKQEPVKMAMALWGYFMQDGIAPGQKQEMEDYLKPRVRNAVEALIEEDNPGKIEVLEEKGWFGEKELEEFMKTARERHKTQALVSLMKVKDAKYGYKEEEFDL